MRREPRAAVSAVHPLDQLRLDLTAASLDGGPARVRSLHGSVAGPGPAAVSRQPFVGTGAPVVVAAGALMGGPLPARRFLGRIAVAAARGLPVAAVGVAVAPGRVAARRPALRAVDRGLARQLAVHARLIVVRSEAAAHRLAVAGIPAPIRVGADMAWLQHPVTSAIQPSRNGDLVVAGDPSDAHVAAALAEALPSASKVGLRPVLGRWEYSGPVPGEIGRVVDRRHSPAVVADRIGWTDAGSAFSCVGRASAVIALDPDAQILAALTRTPAVVVSDDEECLTLAEELAQPTISPVASGRRLGHVLGGVVGRTWQGEPAVERLRRRAVDSVRLVQLVLGGTTSVPADDRASSRPASELAKAADGLQLWPGPSAR